MIDPIKKWIKRITKSLVPGGDLATRTIRSGFWETAINVSTRVLELLVLIVLANLLAPQDFGLIGIALLVLGALNRFSRLGLNQALIQHEDDEINRYLNTVWVLNLCRGILLATITFVAAPFVAAFFNEPPVTDLLRFLALSPLLQAISNPGVVYFEKDLRFHRKFLYRVTGSVANSSVALGFALVYQNVWPLAFGFVAADLVRLPLSYWIHDFRPKFGFNTQYASELIGYGKWITASNIVYFLLDEGDDFVVGWLVSSAALGFYKMAYRIGNAPATEITNVIGDVMFSAFSKLQNDSKALQNAFLRTIQITTLVSFPTSVGVVVVSPVFVRGFLGEEWLPMVTAMQILAIYGFLLSFTETFHKLWKALDHPDYVTKIGVVRLIIMAVLIFPAVTRYGIEGVAVTVLGVYLVVTLPINLYLLDRTIGMDMRSLAGETGYPFVASILMGLIVFGTRRAISPGSTVLEFFLLVALGICSYSVIVIAFDTVFDWKIRQNLTTIVDAFRT
jgi:PST family polysaccharide transporter/lipopolysaccharide exporter